MDANKFLLDQALAYAMLGWKVFPVKLDKTPYISNGFKGATSDTTLINLWWGQQFPGAGIGIATGKVSGIVVLDIDLDKGGNHNLDTLVSKQGEFPQTVVARTGGGGFHIYFKHPGKTVGSTTRLFGLAGIDVRGDGGYVIAPPSPHISNNDYVWEPNQTPFSAPPGECPDWLVRHRGAKGVNLTATIPDGERNSTLTAIGGLLRSMGIGEDDIFTVLMSQNLQRCTPPLPEEEVQVIARQMATYPPFSTLPTAPPPTDTPFSITITTQQNEVGQGTDLEVEGAGLVAQSDVVRRSLLAFERSEVGWGQMIAFYLSGKVRYNHNTGEWYFWRGTWWVKDWREEIIQRAVEVGKAFQNACELINDEEERDKALRWSSRIRSLGAIQSGLQLARSNPLLASDSSDWNARPHLLACENVVIDLKTGNPVTPLPSDYLSLHSPVTYDKDAQCPRWLKFLDEVFLGNAEVIEFIQRAVGYTLTGMTSEQCMFLCIGNGANGKSVMLEAIRRLLGPYAFVTPFSTFEKQPNQTQTNDLAQLVGRRLVVASETTVGSAFNEGRIKSLTGGEPISARFLHQEYFEFHPICKIWLGVNHAPRVADESMGFWRRVKRIDFKAEFTGDNCDPELGDKLGLELSGILNWAIQGAVMWYKDGLKIPETVVSATKSYQVDSDPLYDFKETYLVQDGIGEVPTSDTYRYYVNYCKTKELKPYEILGSARFRERLSTDFPRYRSQTGVEVYGGVSFVEGITGLTGEYNVTINMVKTDIDKKGITHDA